MTRILVAAALILVAVTLYSFFDCVVRDRAHIRVLPKWGWLLVILLVPVFGLLLWFLFGRSSFGQRRSVGPVAPDDDPDYLQKIADDVEQAERRKRREEIERRRRSTGTGSTAAAHGAQAQSQEDVDAPATPQPFDEPAAEPGAAFEELSPHEQFERWLAEREREEQAVRDTPDDHPESGENGANSANGRS
ncbi:PLD nuclease N-terminal domain-containing protein [Brevibacterium sp. p3-SID960]|uniref:PLD nuclease N-terminal domain-containing protein n=1 Tax=Brevibacterium sp. p3-SID960 TaxID=2916063 RepID=UPI0021A5F171|nr:PLD nuclease N-terminal domain-containing protein [Brevibacterium sp. p3-SID960]MCT1689565.1 PLD nuclease N-terminal domain-containing protein [Brevibacterium sp. p3-SID960]